jgi:hypothetical protein
VLIKKLIVLCVATVLSVAATEGVLRWLDVGDPPVFESNPRYGYLMRPSQSASTRGRRYWINQAGFRGADFAAVKRPEAIRVVFLGDSITYGGGQIAESDLFVNRVARMLEATERRRVEPVNLSVPGWGLQNMAAYVAEKGLHDADLLVWVISAVDFRRPKATLEENGFWESKPVFRTVYLASWSTRVARHLLGARAVAVADTPSRPSETLELNVSAVDATLRRLRSRGLPCLMVLVPADPRYGTAPTDGARFSAVANTYGVPVADMGTVFGRHPAEKLFADGVHLTVQGHALVAQAITPVAQAGLR